MEVVLIGFMGSGKTTVSRLLSAQMQLPVSDLDEVIVKAAGKSISGIFADHGETYFRELEQRELKGQLEQDGILATGGGTPINEENAQLLTEYAAPVILLDVEPETAYARIKNDLGRPLVSQLNQATMRQLKNSRNEQYYACADLIIHCDYLSPEEISQQIMKYLNKS
ncbi:hypothetical protein BGL34_06155 [Fructilactobacillus lindneri]|uniref:Shikimate kinase n=2 Tax=Fructilactobacillus lindneri TaxID=53444 RepID=A0A0R2K1K2_9LACO|nr:shikimate kinase [Fructilactobacillus lindneri]ANZ57489.1 hypothetical protein AYR60_01160 [Fructilactobacillus lindneri]ANZ58757.1 hypothetical protein AYR59_01160 [Fructilactobacillus lindneri]KRN80474.1 shikimate kinase [Fructilactobacillus lindneri DSM 20690 = JCM 11027]POG97813.1 hypothetical protein BGL31_05620 [Fructilactobacillus lindneri]POG99146.1 hypothetical protein BGL32_05645 [Fructilactobacillus lindneri]